ILSISCKQCAELQGVVPLLPGNVIGRHDVRGRGEEREIWAIKQCGGGRRIGGHTSVVKDNVGNSVREAAAGELKRELESVGSALPGVARGRNALLIPGD